MKPFRVIWTFSRPIVVPQYPIHLDALLAAARVEEARFAGDSDPFAAQHDLPFERLETEDGFVFKASRLQFVPASGLIQVPVTRKTDVHDLARDMTIKKENRHDTIGPTKKSVRTGKRRVFQTGKLGSVNLRSGYLKTYAWLQTAHWAGSAEAIGVGDVDRVRGLLGRITNIGAIRRNNFGQIDAMTIAEIEPGDVAAEGWRWRAMPASFDDGGFAYARTLATVRPPYWRASDRVLAMEPVADDLRSFLDMWDGANLSRCA